jgi:hypothetical protein
MLSLERCRELLSLDQRLDDGQLEKQRDAFYALAELIVEIAHDPEARALVESKIQKVTGFDGALQTLEEDEREEVEERASIMEFDGEIRRDDAERAALAQCLGGKEV